MNAVVTKVLPYVGSSGDEEAIDHLEVAVGDGRTILAQAPMGVYSDGDEVVVRPSGKDIHGFPTLESVERYS